MVILIGGASHTGKTNLAQRLLEKYKYPYLSIDHLKMGLIRSGNCRLTPMSDTAELTEYLWKILREMIKTAIENGQNLIVEGCYIPFDWKKDFEESYLSHIRYICLIMSERYIRSRFEDIKKYADVIEQRLDGSDCSMEFLLRENAQNLDICRKHGADYLLIDGAYNVDFEFR
ncbi:MAG: ATP-binding protein [Prevotella sp.]|nr:ATP-binding protein [Prevotella sp.]